MYLLTRYAKRFRSTGNGHVERWQHMFTKIASGCVGERLTAMELSVQRGHA